MDIRVVLLHVEDDRHYGERETLALKIAREHQAQVIGLFVAPYPPTVAYAEPLAIEEVVRQHQRRMAEESQRLHETLQRHANAAGVPIVWRQEEGIAYIYLAAYARYTDVVIVAQHEKEDPAHERRGYNLPEELVVTASRPLLVVPFAGKFDSVGRRVMVAWNGSREAARALYDSLPLLEQAEKVVVYCVNEPGSNQIETGEAAATYLTQHGVRAEAHHSIAKDIDAADALLSAAFDHGSDLMVMGAYGHSRVRELVLGGVTRHVLRHMTMPVSMAH